MKQLFSTGFTVLLFLIVFLCLQLGVNLVCMLVWHDFSTNALAIIIASSVTSVLTIGVFAWLRWSPFSRDYLRSAPWATLLWVIILALGTLIPSMALEEWMGVDMDDNFKQFYETFMSRREGYLAVGILAPIAEEMVFRGAVLRLLLQKMEGKWHWAAIALSALLFGIVHGNLAQGIHAFLLGLLLGWLYYRTDSIVPGIVLHWVNNSVAFAVSNIMPQWNDAKLTDVFGSQQNVLLAVGFSLLIFLPALWQIAIRNEKEVGNRNL